ncbi:MAG TPA: glycosyltransferase family 1 protein [Acidimicrobiales bacterium]|nr:glycosyltransferase family 1 protein [Acidimicrobiales bacterium]
MTRARVLMVVEQLRRATPGGIGTYARGLLQGLGELDPGEMPEVELLASRPRPDQDNPLADVPYPVHNSVLPGPLLTRAWDRGVLRAPNGFDVIHAVSLATLEPGRAALVSTIHDLLWRRLPDAYPPRGRAWHEAALQRALRRADQFIVTSNPVASDLEKAGADPDVITVIPMGCDHLPPPDLEAGASLLRRIGVQVPFLLSVGTLEPRKNLHRLIEAYQGIRGSLPDPWPLVLVGPSGWGEQVRPGPGVVLAGMVTPGELSALYSMTQLLAYVPLIEGFGLPPVEAMVFGTPVVASPLPSTAGAAFEVDPQDTGSIARGLLVVATDTEVRSRLQLAGRHRAGELKWSTIARRHVSVWDSAASRNRGHRDG